MYLSLQINSKLADVSVSTMLSRDYCLYCLRPHIRFSRKGKRKPILELGKGLDPKMLLIGDP
jgi:hypothetical protein